MNARLEEVVAQLDKERKRVANKASTEAAAYMIAANAAAKAAEAKRVGEELQKRFTF